MSAIRNIRLLMWRNYIKRKRSLCSCCCEFLFPIVIVGLFVALFQAFSNTNYPDKQYLSNLNAVPNLAGMGYRATTTTSVIAIAPAVAGDAVLDDIVSDFNATLAQWYPGFNATAGLAGTAAAAFMPNLPSLASATYRFNSEADMDAFVKSTNYAMGGNIEIIAGIVFVSGPPNWEYKIRCNNTEVADSSLTVDNLQISMDPSNQNTYLWPKRVYRGKSQPRNPLEKVQRPGFSAFQLLVDRYIVNSTTSTPLSDSALQSLMSDMIRYITVPGVPASQAVQGALSAILNNATEKATLMAELAKTFRAELQTPQRVSVLPFPTTAYKQNDFYTTTAAVFAFLFSFSFLYPASRLLRDVVLEKQMKMREGMRAMGLGTGSLLTSWYLTYALMVFAQSIIITLISIGNIFDKSQPVIIFLLFFLFGMSTMSFGLVVSVFFSRAKTAMIAGVLLLFGSIFPYIGVSSSSYSMSAKMAASVLPSTAFALTLKRISDFETNAQGVTSSNVNDTTGNYSVGGGLGMLALMMILYLVVLWYLDNIVPSEFGVPLHPTFPFTAKYWRGVLPCFRGKKRNVVATSNHLNTAVAKAQLASRQPDGLIEPADSHMNSLADAGKVIQLTNLRKEFVSSLDKTATRVAVDGVDLTMYEGQIFVLLGHNGAGKTTTASMITGLLPPTSGGISVYGRPVPESLEEVRNDIGMGVCPQHDVLYPDLTVSEHLELFAGLKGVPSAAVKGAIAETIATVGLTEKTNALAASLSGGQKRKLSVGIALIGGSKVVILDEPTSGMDPYSRRSTWQMLKNAREGRIMILTTHFMDEADLLGDRIAIMSNGRVACCGSPLFLKSKFGVGYQMSIVKAASGTKVDDVTDIVKSVNGAEMISNVGTELSFRLPIQESAKFPAMLSQLDANLADLGIMSYGIGVTTMEEVFLRVAKEHEGDHLVDESPAPAEVSTGPVTVHVRPSSSEPRPPQSPSPEEAKAADAESGTRDTTISDLMKHARHDGTGMFLKHMRALLLKRYQYFKRDVKGLLFLVVIPIAVVLVIVALLDSSPFTNMPDTILTTKPYNDGGVGTNRVPYFDYKSGTPNVGPPTFETISNVMTAYQSISPGGREAIMGLSESTYVGNSSGFIGANSSAVSYLEPGYILGLQTMNAFLLNNKSMFKESKYGAYLYDNVWLPAPDALSYTMFQNSTSAHATAIFMNLMNAAIYKNVTGGSGSITLHNYPLLYTRRQTAFLDGVLTFFIALGIVIGFSFVAAFYATFLVYERENNVKHQQLISGISVNAYWLSTLVWDVVLFQLPMWGSIIVLKAFNVTQLMGTADLTRATILLFFFYGWSTAGLTYCMSYVFKSASAAQNAVIFFNLICMILIIISFVMGRVSATCKADESLRYIWMLLPGFAIGDGFVKLAFLPILPSFTLSCSGGVQPGKTVVYAAMDMEAAGVNILYMATTAVGYFCLALGMDYVLASPFIRKKFAVSTHKASPADTAGEDSDVAVERARMSAGVGADKDVLAIRDIRKVYGSGKVAVKSLSFGVPIGQCFGFLGINGAGKTTTLKMLSGEILPSEGSASIAGFDILTQQMQLRRLLGYCPQFDALYDLLTVKEHLELFARIKGIPEPKVPATVASFIALMDLTPFQHKQAGTLSGGNKRKLSVAIALIGEPPVVFLDEPSTGMDPVARRKLWNIIARVATERKICSVILTTHSMEECEALCARLGIMVDGQLQCLGSIQHLKAKFGTGFSAEFKLGDAPPSLAATVSARLSKLLEGRTTIDLLAIPQLCASVGLPDRALELSDSGTGWAVFAALQRAGSAGIPLQDMISWWADEDQADGLTAYITRSAFPGAKLVERHGSKLYFHLPPQTMPLSAMFERLEHAKSQLNILEYSLSQTTLEQIFNKFAAKQEGEKGVARGMMAAHDGAAAAPQGQAPSSGGGAAFFTAVASGAAPVRE